MKSAAAVSALLVLIACEQSGTKSGSTGLGASSELAQTPAEQPSTSAPKSKLQLRGEVAEQTLAAEAADPAFAPAHEVAVRAKINALPDTVCLSVTCKRTLCKAVVAFSTAKARNTFYDGFLSGVDRPIASRVGFASWVAPTPDGNPKTRILWLTKPGCALPDSNGNPQPCVAEPLLPDTGPPGADAGAPPL